jgi:hypothetical protein
MSITRILGLPKARTAVSLGGVGMAMYRKVMRERLTSSSRGSSTAKGGGKIRLRSSHRRVSSRALRVSHSRPGTWEPPMKDVDREEVIPLRRSGKKG